MKNLQENFLFHNGLKMDKEFNYTLEYLLHGLNVANLSLYIGEYMELDVEQRILLYYGGLFHDIGKSVISEDILFKKGLLTKEEKKLISWHPFFSSILVKKFIYYDIESNNGDYLLRNLPRIILYHHEDYDGGGYPLGLVGKQIPFLSRILRIIDVFDSLLSRRNYRDQRYDLITVLNIMDNMAHKKFDKDLYFKIIRPLLAKYKVKG